MTLLPPFPARLKSIPSSEIEAEVNARLKDVELEDAADQVCVRCVFVDVCVVGSLKPCNLK